MGLVVTRKVGEQIVIEAGKERIIVTPVQIRTSKQVRIEIEASQEVKIHREEHYDKITKSLMK